jgi:Cu2+-exporting ATPase
LRVSDFRYNFRQASASLDKLADYEGVKSIRCSAWCASAVIEYDPLSLTEKQLLARVKSLAYGPDTMLSTAAGVPVLKEPKLVAWLRKLLFMFNEALPAGVQLALGVLAFALPVLRVPAFLSRTVVLASTAPLAVRAVRALLDERKLGIDALDGMAASLMIVNGRLVEAGFMTALIALGELIREKTARRCEQMVSDLLGLSGRSAWLMRGNKRICVAADEVKPGDVVVVYPGDMVPVDGTVISGEAAIDQSQLTGESLPVEVKCGDKVFAATAAVEGKVYVRCEASGVNTRAGLVLQCVENAPIHETNIQNYAAQIADKAVLPIFLASGACFLLTRDVSRVMSMLIMDFCTGIRIAAPTAVLASMQRAGRHGILIKNGAALEKLASVSAIVFDKTGTLTSGEPKVEQISRFNGRTEDEVLSLAAAVEMRLHHPAARAIIRAAQGQGLTIPERDGSTFIRGMGAKSRVGSSEVIVGSKRMMTAEGIEIDETRESELQAKNLGESVTFVAVDGKVAGLIRYRDRLRPEVLPAIKELRRLGIKKLVMATGDADEAAQRIAERCAIREVKSRAFPEDKVELVKKLKEAGHTVAVIGDGINDSPALAYADVAISLHCATEAARSGADLVLTDDNLARLPEAIRVARSAIALVKQNMAMAVLPNAAGLGMAALGAIGPAGATLLNNGSAIAAAVNSLRPLYSSDWSKDDAAVSDLTNVE